MVFHKWVIGIEQNKFQDQFRACMNSFQISPKHVLQLAEMALGEVTCGKQDYMKFKVMGVVFVNGDGPCSKIQHMCKNYPLPIDTFHLDSLKHICSDLYAPRLCEAVFQQCKPFLKHAKGNHRFESNLDLICNDLMECGRKIKFGTSPFSQIYISEPLHDKTKVHRSSHLLEVILFLGKYKTGNVGSYSYSQKQNIQGPKTDQGKTKYYHLLIYEPNRSNLHITADRYLTTVHFAIPLDVY